MPDPLWVQVPGIDYSAAEDRRLISAMYTPGVISGLTLTASVGLTVSVSAGQCVVSDGVGGSFLVYFDTPSTVTLPASTTAQVWATVNPTTGAATLGGGASVPTNPYAVVGSAVTSSTGVSSVSNNRVMADSPTAPSPKYVGASSTTVNAATLNGKPEGSLTVGAAGNAERVGNDTNYMRFHWSGQSGQPPWVWGGASPSDMYVYNPANFSVANSTNAIGFTIGGGGYTSGSTYNFTKAGDPLYLTGTGLAGTGATMIRDSTTGRVGFTTSSRALKTAIVDIPISVAALRSLRPVFFKYNNDLENVDDTHGTQGGFIAEEVQEHFPEAVLKDQDGQPADLLDRSLLAGAYRLIEDLYAKIEALESRLQAG